MVSSGAPIGRPVLAPPLRRPALMAVALAVLVFGALAARYGGASSAGRIDGRIESIADTVDPVRTSLGAVVDLGNPLPVVVLAGVLSALALMLGQRRLAVLALLGPGLTGAATTLLKPLIGRTLDGNFAYPSGHTGAATALGLVAALLLVGVLRAGRGIGATIIAAGALLAGGGMATALVVRDEHYPTDTIGGFCTAVALVLASALLIEWCADRIAARRARPPAGPA